MVTKAPEKCDDTIVLWATAAMNHDFALNGIIRFVRQIADHRGVGAADQFVGQAVAENPRGRGRASDLGAALAPVDIGVSDGQLTRGARRSRDQYFGARHCRRTRCARRSPWLLSLKTPVLLL